MRVKSRPDCSWKPRPRRLQNKIRSLNVPRDHFPLPRSTNNPQDADCICYCRQHDALGQAGRDRDRRGPPTTATPATSSTTDSPQQDPAPLLGSPPQRGLCWTLSHVSTPLVSTNPITACYFIITVITILKDRIFVYLFFIMPSPLACKRICLIFCYTPAPGTMLIHSRCSVNICWMHDP